MATRPTCQMCAAYNVLTKQCRRKSPTLVTVNTPKGLQFLGTWPGSDATDWCMEFIATAEGEPTQ